MALQRLGPFDLLRVLGRGGMGTVYEAREVGSDESVAVKALSPAYSFDEHFRNRFEAEIDALMSLDHENIVRLLSYGQDEGNLFFAMELVDGASLFQEQKKGQVFHWQEIIDIGIQVCDGLRHAHDRGIIHRDMKPGNLMITTDRRIKITDFGIAKSFGSSSLTSEGNVLGTMDFMSPEQARGNNTTARSDLFSLGAVMYSLLAGRPPFLRETVEQTFEALLSPGPPDRLDKVAPDIPRPLAQLIHRMMEKDPSRRIATAQATGRQMAHVRDQVKSTPKMDTVVRQESDDFDTASTRVIADHVTGPREAGDTSARPDSGSRPTSEERPGARDIETGEMKSRQPDYFNEVTPQQRQKKSEIITSEETSSIWPVFIALMVVLAMAAAGVWFALFRQPSRDDLLNAIQKAENNPTRVQEQIRQFIKWYPEDEEIDFITELNDRVEVTKYVNTLRSRKNLSTNNPPTQAESKFLEIYTLAREDLPRALKQIDSFLQFYEGLEGLTSVDSRAVEMARRIRVHWARIANREIDEGRRLIQDQLIVGRRSGNREHARGKFTAIIDMYESNDWAADLVEEARQELAKLDALETEDQK